jgi:hypothetical protein
VPRRPSRRRSSQRCRRPDRATLPTGGVGVIFVAIWADGDALRALRFTRASGPLDPDGGLLLTSGHGTITRVAAASVGSRVIAAWRATTGTGVSAVRALHIGPDGTIGDAAPIEVTGSIPGSAVSVAANPSATLVSFSRLETVGSSVRAVLFDH